MQKDSNNANQTDADTSENSPDHAEPLYSYDEVRSMVKDFIRAWIGQDVQIDFPQSKEIRARLKSVGRKIEEGEALNQELNIKLSLTNLIAICTGHKGASPEEQKKAIYGLFQEILDYRLGNRIRGKFGESNTESRFIRLEEDIKDLNKRFEDLYFYVRTHIPDENAIGGT